MHHVSGDADSVVPVTSTRYSINAMKLPIKVPWYAWYHREQVHTINSHLNVTYLKGLGFPFVPISFPPPVVAV